MVQEKTDYGIWSKLIGNNIDINRYGIISVITILVGCLGGIVVGLGAIESYLQLAFIVLATMASLSTVLAVAPMKYILNLAVLAVIIDLIILVYNLVA
jgi:hypothetical protein